MFTVFSFHKIIKELNAFGTTRQFYIRLTYIYIFSHIKRLEYKMNFAVLIILLNFSH